MKVLQVFVLSAIVISCVAGSYRGKKYYGGGSPKKRVTKKSLTKKFLDEMNTKAQASSQTQGREPLERIKTSVNSLDHDVNIGDVIRTKDVETIVSSIKKLGQANKYVLEELYHRRPEVVEKVLEEVVFPQEALINLASSKELTCHPEGFLMLLNRMRSEADRVTAIERGIDNLFAQTDRQCIPPLLIAMKGRPLESVAVKRAFEGATKAVRDYEPGVLWCTFDHPTITREIYAKTLFALAKRSTLSQTLKWLLERADTHDLDALQAMSGYNYMTSDIHASIDHAKRKASDRTLRIPTPATLSTPTSRGSYNNLHPHMPEYEQLFGYGI